MAMVTGAGEMLYLKSCLEFLLNSRVLAVLRSDSVAGRGMVRRQGLGRVRHLETQYLWIQQKLAEQWFKMGPIAGLINPGDIGTKPVAIGRLNFLLCLCGMVDVHNEFEVVGTDEMSKYNQDMQLKSKLKEALKVFRACEDLSSNSPANAMVEKVMRVVVRSAMATGASG